MFKDNLLALPVPVDMVVEVENERGLGEGTVLSTLLVVAVDVMLNYQCGRVIYIYHVPL